MHKYLIWAACLPAFSTSAAYAADHDGCKAIASVAKMVMESRQEGLPMPDMMEIIVSSDSAHSDLGKQLVIAAYDKPRFGTDQNKRMAVTDFQNEVYLKCIK